MITNFNVSLQPTNFQQDLTIHTFVQHREQAMIQLIDKLQKRIEPSCFQQVTKLLEIYQTLPAAIRQEIIMHPHYQHWWFRLSQYYKEGDRQKLEQWLPGLARFLVIPALCYDCWPEQGMVVPISRTGEVRFPSYLSHVVLPEVSDPGLVYLRKEDHNLSIRYQEKTYNISLANLFDANSPDIFVAHRLAIPGTRIEVDCDDLWTSDFLDYLQKQDTTFTNKGSDIQPAFITKEDIPPLEAAIKLISQCWPEMQAEIARYVSLIVPFTSPTRHAFSNTAWGGAIFLRAQFDDSVYTLERIVHEASHLRLNLIMTQEQLHQHNWNDRVPSPFRPGLRPVTGLYHGAFVFTRVAITMDRAFRMTGNLGYLQRIPPIVDQVIQALETIHQHVRLTTAGQLLIEEIASEIQSLQNQYPADDVTAEKATDPYTQEW